MRCLKIFIGLLLLITTPSFLLNSENPIPPPLPKAPISNPRETPEPNYYLSYDKIMHLLDEIESGEFERKSAPEGLKRVNQFVALLAKKGAPPNDMDSELALEEDIDDLLNAENRLFEYAPSFTSDGEYILTPTIYYEQVDKLLCKSWAKKQWKKTKQFIKDHKKEIIIGAAIVVAAAVVVVAVVVTSAAAGATAGGAAGAAGAAIAEQGGKEQHSPPLEEEATPDEMPIDPPLVLATPEEMPLLKNIIDKHALIFKEFAREEIFLEPTNEPAQLATPSVGDHLKEFGSNLAHQIFDGVTELAVIIPELEEEIKYIASKILPENLPFFENISDFPFTPMENYERWIASGHDTIDTAFGTDQAARYTREAKVNAPDVALGIPPPPGLFFQIFSNAGKVIDRAGFTKAGRGLMKHGYREGSVFPKPFGNPEQVNRQGQAILEEILSNPNKQISQLPNGDIKIYAPNGRGVHFREDQSFKGFIEQQYE